MTSILDRVILHTIVHHSLTSTYMRNFIKIEETCCKRTDVHADERTDESHLIRSTQKESPPNKKCTGCTSSCTGRLVGQIYERSFAKFSEQPWPLTFWPLGQCMPSEFYRVYVHKVWYWIAQTVFLLERKQNKQTNIQMRLNALPTPAAIQPASGGVGNKTIMKHDNIIPEKFMMQLKC